MQHQAFDAVVIGGGAAGMAAALEIDKNGGSVAIVEREDSLGGILMQCIHNGFGLHEFKEELTGPEYAERFMERVAGRPIKVFTRSTVTQVVAQQAQKELTCYSATQGALMLSAKAVVLAMGCRERNRGNIGVAGSRPAGIFTAGLAQRLVNIEGYLPGREVVIIGSGDIGLIMARRMSWAGAHVKAVLEIMPYPSGLTRNIVQCLHDFNIPLYLSHVVSRIHGRHRISGVDVTPLTEGTPDYAKDFHLPCDTLLLSVGLLPENELSRKMGVELNPQTGGPYVDTALMTSLPGVFACGNVLHVHDLVDFVTEESGRVGHNVMRYLEQPLPVTQYRVKSGPNVRYVVPNQIDPEHPTKLYLRSLVVKQRASLEVKWDGRLIKRLTKNHLMPSEMISLTLRAEDFKNLPRQPDSSLSIAITSEAAP